MSPRLILASASPRRAELLRRLDVDFEIEISDVDEYCGDMTDAKQYAVQTALRKAAAVALRHMETTGYNVGVTVPDQPTGHNVGATGAIVIGADTVVVAPGGELLGKPADKPDAARMLAKLSGGWHEVHTGVALICLASGRETTGVETTRVKFRDLDQDMIQRYIDKGESSDKAGAYAAQGYGALLIERISGCFFNVMGLPLARLADMLMGYGYRLL
jgi:septum formation protein